MGSGYVTALFGLLGALVGGLTSFATNFATQKVQLRESYRLGERVRLENLFRDFISEATRLHVDALSHEKDDLGDLVKVYGILANMRLYTTPRVISAAQEVLDTIIETYSAPNLSFREVRAKAKDGSLDLLQEFSEASREALAPLSVKLSH